MDKRVTLVSVLAVIGFPVAIYSAVTAYHHRADARMQLQVLQQHDVRMEEFRKEAAMFKQYQERSHAFLNAAKAEGVVSEAWDRRRFDVENRIVSYRDLSDYIRKANHNANYYFIPERLDLKTPEKALKDNASGSIFQYYDRSKPVLALTMQGELLVKAL